MTTSDVPEGFPAYIRTHRDGSLQQKASRALGELSACALCPRRCGVNRLEDEKGRCATGRLAWVSSFGPHFGEEDPLVGRFGSGTIFFTHCNLGCNFCQNYEISHGGEGEPVTDAQLAAMMLDLQDRGCHNINFVTPSHVVPQILSALCIAAGKGLKVPLVFNTGGYDRVRTLALLDGVVDIYMPDFKFWDPEVARLTCDAADYPETARRALREMHRQVGDLVVDEQGLARRGILLRHLVLPDGLAGTREVMGFIAREISKNTYVNVMAQYRPCGQLGEIQALRRSIRSEEYRQALEAARQEGIRRLDRRRRTFALG